MVTSVMPPLSPNSCSETASSNRAEAATVRSGEGGIMLEAVDDLALVDTEEVCAEGSFTSDGPCLARLAAVALRLARTVAAIDPSDAAGSACDCDDCF